LIIKPIQKPELIKEVAGIEAATWGIQPGEAVPDHILTTIAHEGGVLLGAYDGSNLVGFALGWLGTIISEQGKPAADQLKLVSHMTGILDGYRNRRIGFQLKLAQRDWALKRDLDLITWTYDPLESRNAYLNIHLLGCICQTYFRDYYGEMSDELNRGIPSDRLRVDWWIRSEHVVDRIDKTEQKEQPSSEEKVLSIQGQLLNPADHDSGPLPNPVGSWESPQEDQILIEIPCDIQTLRQLNKVLAHDWRIHTRDLFEKVFSEDYQVVDLIYQRGEKPRSFYLLKKGTDEDR
jgi:predicted GNAT superfamily acetyltransferase